MEQLFPYFLFLHVLGAIIAFGPPLSTPVIAPLVAREPQHANFYSRLQARLTNRVILPAALSMPVTGALMIASIRIDVLATRWLAVAIVLYVIAIVYAIVFQRSAAMRMVELTSRPPKPGVPGPPPELVATAASLQRGGSFLGLLIVTIAFLMVVKPSF